MTDASTIHLGELIRVILKATAKDLRKYDGILFGMDDISEGLTLTEVINSLVQSGKKYELIDHPKSTKKVIEKIYMFDDHHEIYLKYGDIGIVKGLILSYKGEDGTQKLFLYFSCGRDNVKLSKIKKSLKIETDVIPYNGSINLLLGIAVGEVSPFIPITERIEGIYFDKSMIEYARENPSRTYDIATSNRQSLFANIADVYDALLQNHRIAERIKQV